jgi:hypothetical protein
LPCLRSREDGRTARQRLHRAVASSIERALSPALVERAGRGVAGQAVRRVVALDVQTVVTACA